MKTAQRILVLILLFVGLLIKNDRTFLRNTNSTVATAAINYGIANNPPPTKKTRRYVAPRASIV